MSEKVSIEAPTGIGELPEANLWMTPESRSRLSKGGNSKGSVPVHGQKSATATIPIYTAKTLQDERVRCFNLGAAKGDSLVGNWFHSIVDGQVKWQGQILGSPSQGVYLIQLYEWFMGQPSCRRLTRLEEMTSWLFYASGEEMNYSYEYGTAKEGGQYRKKA